MAEEPKDPIDEYDRTHGRPDATPDKPNQSEADAWGTTLNPVRETPTPFKDVKEVGR